MSNSRSRNIRQLMAQTGMNYTKAALDLARQEASVDRKFVASRANRFRDWIMTTLARMQRAALGLPDADKLARMQRAALGLPVRSTPSS